MNAHLFSAFLLITIVLFLTPGPIVTLTVATAARSGTRAALLSVAGSTTGNALLIACIAIGLGWILETSAEVFDVLRWVGAAYLIWLGIQAWRHAGSTAEATPPGGHVYAWRGFVVAMTNPKSIAFFTAFLPQFLDPDTLQQIGHGDGQRQAERHFIGKDAELGADRIRHLPCDERYSDRRRMSRLQRSHDHIEAFGHLRRELPLSATPSTQ